MPLILILRSRLAVLLALSLAGLVVSPTAYAQRDLEHIPDPDPELERQSFIVADGFEVNLYAADPQIAKPIQMNFDAHGRLWIASSEVYPHIKPGQEANDKILVIEDRDQDGVADKTTVFADGLLIPTGVVPGDGGAYVANSTELLHLTDSDQDGRADKRRVVLSGFGTEDTHHLLHTLRWGPDGALYMNQSIYIHSHVETPYGVRRLNGGGVWRFRPETLELEIFCRGFVNAWGHHFDRWGQSFATDGAYGEGINYVFPGSVFVTAPDAKRILHGLNPGSPKHCGLEVVSGRHLPESWQGNMITNDFRAHRVCRFVVSDAGSAYSSRQEVELIKSTHVAFRPIDVKMGPDGAIYIADWYNPIIQHGEVDFRDPRRDHTHGRIWRVTAKGRPLVDRPDWDKLTTAELLDLLKTPEEWNRLWAKLLLKQRGAEAVREPLQKWIAALDPQDPDYEHHRLEALWAQQGVRDVDPTLLGELLVSPDYRVRAAAMRVLSEVQAQIPQRLAWMQRGVQDEHPRVRLEAVRAVATQQSAEAARIAMLALDKPLDEFLDFALWQSMRDLQSAWLPLVAQGTFDFGGRYDHLVYALQAVDSPQVVAPLLVLIEQGNVPEDRVQSVLTLIANLGGPQELGAILDRILDPNAALDAPRKAGLLRALVDTSRARKQRPSGDLERIATLFESNEPALRTAALHAAGAWQLESQRERISRWAGQSEVAPPLRHAAMQALAALGGAASVQRLVELSEAAATLEDRQQAAAALATLDVNLAARRVVKLLQGLPDGAGAEPLIAPLLARKEGIPSLTEALAGQELPADAARHAQRAVQAAAVNAPELLEALSRAGRLEQAGWQLNEQLLNELVRAVHESGDAARGEELFRRADLQCTKCHAIAGAGGRVGPDLVSIGASAQVDYLVESLLAPNAKVKENYHAVTVITDEGQLVSGIPQRENDQELVLRDAEDRTINLRQDQIEARRESRSLMPDGLVDSLTRSELVDLVRFLSELGKVGEYAVGNKRFVRSWETLVWTPEAHERLNRTSYDSAATEDPAFSWRAVYSKVSGELPVTDMPKFVVHQGNHPATFVRCHIDVSQPGRVQLALNELTGLSLWIDGRPTPVEQVMVVELDSGRHTLVWAVDRADREQPLRVELQETAETPAQVQVAG